MLSECVQLGNPPESDGIRRNPTDLVAAQDNPPKIRRKSAENPTEFRRNPTKVHVDRLPSAGIRRNPTDSDGIRRILSFPSRTSLGNPPESVGIRRKSDGIRRIHFGSYQQSAEIRRIRRNPPKSMYFPTESAGIRRNPTESDGFVFFCDFVYRKAIEFRWISADSVEIRRKSAGCKNGSAGFRRIPSKSDGFWWIFLGRRARKVTQMMGFAEIRRNPTESGGFGRR